jgi:SAM-dependent methyltransferase
MSESLEQRLHEYYTQTADGYDEAQIHEGDEHSYALMMLRGVLMEKRYQSLLDVGCGTGRTLSALQQSSLPMQLWGIEPVEALRRIAITKGLDSKLILEGSGYALPFADRSIDCVTAFGVLHHVEEPQRVIAEMLRVAKKAIFVSDHNIYGMGSLPTRFGKQMLRSLLGFRSLRFVMTKGRGYHDTNYDGIFYPFSVFEHLEQIKNQTRQMSLISTKGSPVRLYSQASHVAVMAFLN